MFQVFGDKEVLDAYGDAKRHQRETEIELQRFETELDASRTHLDGLHLRIANYHQWEGLSREGRDLQEEILPTLQYHEAPEKATQESRSLREARTALVLQDKALSDKRATVAAQANALSVVQQAEAALEIGERRCRHNSIRLISCSSRKPAGAEVVPGKAGGGCRCRCGEDSRCAGKEGGRTFPPAPAA